VLLFEREEGTNMEDSVDAVSCRGGRDKSNDSISGSAPRKRNCGCQSINQASWKRSSETRALYALSCTI